MLTCVALRILALWASVVCSLSAGMYSGGHGMIVCNRLSGYETEDSRLSNPQDPYPRNDVVTAVVTSLRKRYRVVDLGG
eukprot:350149-Chlamydomonas_euryale.AAC.19